MRLPVFDHLLFILPMRGPYPQLSRAYRETMQARPARLRWAGVSGIQTKPVPRFSLLFFFRHHKDHRNGNYVTSRESWFYIREYQQRRRSRTLQQGTTDLLAVKVGPEGRAVEDFLRPIGTNRRGAVEFQGATGRIQDQVPPNEALVGRVRYG